MDAAAGNIFFYEWETAFMEWFQNSIPQGLFLSAILNNLSLFGEQMLMIAVMGFFYWCWDKEKGRFIGLSVIVASLWNPLVKNIFLRRRPYMDNTGISLFRKIDKEADIMDIAAQGYSFPSGHSCGAVAAYGSLTLCTRKKIFTVLAFLLPLVVGVSRVYVGAHYPTDVICGWALGVVVLIVVSIGINKLGNRPQLYLILLLVSLPGFFYCKSSDYYTSYGMLLGAGFGFLFEERYVSFEGTRKPLKIILRIAGGVAVYFGLNALLKLPFSSAFLESGTFGAYLVRTLRYAAVVFADTGLYPFLFKPGTEPEASAP